MAEKEYIERGAALLEIDKMTPKPNLIIVRERLAKIPAADVVEVRHGEWIKDARTSDVCAEYRCSLCGFMYCESDPKYPPYKYCPECGAKNE